MDPLNRITSNFAYKHMSCKYNSNLFPSCRSLLVDFGRVAWIETNSILPGNSYPSVAVTDRITNTNYKSIYYTTIRSQWNPEN